MDTLTRPTTRRTALLAAIAALSVGSAAVLTSDDPLADLFAQAPAGPAQAPMYRQGIIQAFDPVTLLNTVLVDGVPMHDLPMLGVAEAASLAPGSVVGLHCVGSSWAIMGRFVTPNTADATDAITRVAQGVGADITTATQSTTSTTFTDLATVGPVVTLAIRASGKALVFLGATIAVNPAASALWGGFMNFAAAGANTIAAGATPGGLGYSIGAGASPDNLELSMARLLTLTGLTPGITTFTAKYAIGVGNPGETAQFRNRTMAVFAL
jgi:hypothetical protein